MIFKILISIISIVGIYFMYFLIQDIFLHKEEYRAEKLNRGALAVITPIIYFFSTFGISDFALGTIIYPKLKWVDIKKLLGTINAASAVPTVLMAIVYLNSVTVGTKTLIVCIIAQIIGGYIGPFIVVKLNEEIIKRVIGIGLIIVSFVLILGQLGYINQGGNLKELSGIKLVIAAIALFCFGMLNNIGIGSFSLTMVTMYLLGLDPKSAYPIMMAATTFSIIVGSVQFMKLNSYNRTITLYSSTFGLIGVVIAIFLVDMLSSYYIKWIVLVVFLTTSYTLLKRGD